MKVTVMVSIFATIAILIVIISWIAVITSGLAETNCGAREEPLSQTKAYTTGAIVSGLGLALFTVAIGAVSVGCSKPKQTGELLRKNRSF